MPLIEPPPETTDHVPPAGEPTKLLVDDSQMADVDVVLLAAPGSALTVKV